jgi:ribonuclease HI
MNATFHDDLKAGATGAVLRNYKREFIVASTTYIPHVPSAIMAESYAMKEGLALAIRLGCNHIVAESDSTEVVEACNGI